MISPLQGLFNSQKSFFKMKNLLFLAFLSIVLFSCDKTEKIYKDDIEEIKQYLSDKGLTDQATQTASGMHYIITTPGTGGNPKLSDNVKVKYKGYTTDGSVFDETTNGNIADFPLSNLIQGWQEGIPLLQKGGKGVFILPSHLAYGERGTSGILPNTVLVFEIELVDFY
jgi:FKBP-type peptidyl-prolyl cis-trans isomerase FkpA